MSTVLLETPARRTVTYREYYTRCCIHTFWPADDEHSVARNTCTLDGHLQRVLYQMLYKYNSTSWWWAQCCSKHLHTGRSLTESTIPDSVFIHFDLLMMSTVLLETPAHTTVTYREYYTRCCIYTFWPPDDEHSVAQNTCTPDGHLQRVLYQMLYKYNSTSWWWAQCCSKHLHTGRSLKESTIPDAVLIQFDLLIMSTVLHKTCRGL